MNLKGENKPFITRAKSLMIMNPGTL